MPEPLHEPGLLPLDPVLRAPPSGNGLWVVLVRVVVDAGVLGQVRLAPEAADVVQARCYQHVGHRAPVTIVRNSKLPQIRTLMMTSKLKPLTSNFSTKLSGCIGLTKFGSLDKSRLS